MVSGEIEDIFVFLGGRGGGVRVDETRFIMGDMQMPPRRVKIFPLVNRNNCNKNNTIKAVRH